MDKLKELLKCCKCGVFITGNEHRNYYITAETRLKELMEMECPPELTDDVRQKMIEMDTIINVQFYPNTPIGNYDIYHYDIDTALDEALKCVNKGNTMWTEKDLIDHLRTVGWLDSDPKCPVPKEVKNQLPKMLEKLNRDK